MATKNKIAGLHLYSVRVVYTSFRDPRSVSLWITTSKESIAQAKNKAETFLRNNRADFQKPKIKTIDYHGTIDA